MEFALTLWQAAISFPTVILTTLLGLATLYWVLSLFTGVDGVEGALGSVTEGLAEGALESAADGFEFGSRLGRNWSESA